MKIKSILTFLSLILLTSCSTHLPKSLSQTDKSNFIGQNKNGIWKNFLDSSLLFTNANEAHFFEYVYISDGSIVSRIGIGSWFGGFKCKRVEFDKRESSNTKALNGKVLYYDEKNKIRAKSFYENGYLKCLEVYYKDGSKRLTEDYTKMYDDIEFTGYVTLYKRNGLVKENYYFRPVEGNWLLMPSY